MRIIWLGHCFKEFRNRQSPNEMEFCDSYLSPSAGEFAITLAVKKIFADFYPDVEVIRFDREQLRNNFDDIKRIVRDDDIIFIHGGEHGASFIKKGADYEDFRKNDYWQREPILSFPKNRIISLGCTFYYGEEENYEGIYKIIIDEDRKIFDRENLVIMARDCTSYDELKKWFSGCKCKIVLCPDPVLYFKPLLDTKPRTKALVLLRHIHESRFGDKDKETIIKMVKSIIPNVDVDDINATYSTRLRSCLRKYQEYKVVITDRYHGMIFASLTHTPCVAIDDALPHKLSGAQCFFNPASIKCVKEISEIPDAIRTVIFSPFKPKDLSSYFKIFEKFYSPSENTFSDDLMKLIISRRTIRTWLNKPVEEEKLDKVLRAGIWCPTACNSQKVKLCIIRDKTKISNIVKYGVAAMPKNNPDKIILVLFDLNKPVPYDMNYRKVNPLYSRFIWQDTSCSMMNMILMAESLGLKTCWVSTITQKEHDYIIELLRINRRFILCCMLFIGYSNQKVSLDGKFLGTPLMRNEKEIIIEEKDLNRDLT